MEEKLKKWQILYIDNVKYVVVNMIEYKEDTWIWQEYEIKNELNEHKWLCVEKDEYGQTEYSIYTSYCGSVNKDKINFTANGKKYELYEKGIATVKNYFGNVDVDKYETCQYIDYITKDKTYVISVEILGDEIEKSQGKYIDNSRVRITNEIDTKKLEEDKKNARNDTIASLIICGIFILMPIIFFTVIVPLLSGLFVNKSMQKYMEKQLNYAYVTSVTNNSNNKKAIVYKSPYSTIDQTVKNIIDGVPEGITDIIDSEPNTDEDGIGLYTKKEFAYIYLENGIVYVQVSEKEYANNTGGSTYHSHHYSNYHKTYSSTRKSITYTNYSNSARQQSINSRTTSGGGTSSGK